MNYSHGEIYGIASTSARFGIRWLGIPPECSGSADDAAIQCAYHA
jgi:hypothetical protein